MENKEKESVQLPENAFRELKEGEEYQPIMHADQTYPEVNAWSVTWGILMAMSFSAAAAYLGLKVGQVFEAAIPIAIIAVGVSTIAKRNKALGENVIIQSIGACSGAVVAGAIFTLPAIYTLQAKYPEMSASFMKIFTSSALGRVIGILFLIPFRKYFVSDVHGKYPFPETTATTQVLMSGVKGGLQAKPLLMAGLVDGLYDFVVVTFGWWNGNFITRVFDSDQQLADQTKLIFKVNTGAAVMGLGYIIGLKYTFIVCMGLFAVWWLIVPGLSLLFGDTTLNIGGTNLTMTVGEMSPELIFTTYGKSIGIGGIAMVGITGIIKSWGTIKNAVGLVAKEMKDKGEVTKEEIRTRRDISLHVISVGSIAAILVTFVFFLLGVVHNFTHALIAILLVAIIAFLFTTVAANAIAIVDSNPVSGMTLMTLILASVVMAAVGLNGPEGTVAALIMGGVVCTALSMAGTFVIDLKIGYWLGTTSARQETRKSLGTLISATIVGGVMVLLNQAYGFDPAQQGYLVAPQANAMAAVIEPLMNGTGVSWILYGIGALLATILTLFKIPALAFALGMFIPLELNTPLLIDGAIHWFVTTHSKNNEVNEQRGEEGTLLAGGFITGGALVGVLSVLLCFTGFNPINPDWLANPPSELLSLAAYLLLTSYFILATRDKNKAWI